MLVALIQHPVARLYRKLDWLTPGKDDPSETRAPTPPPFFLCCAQFCAPHIEALFAVASLRCIKNVPVARDHQHWFSYREEYLRSIGVFKEAVLAILACIAKQERVRLSERVQAGLSRARAQGKVLGRPKAAVRPERVRRLRQGGLSIRQIAAETGVSPMTVQRLLAAGGG